MPLTKKCPRCGSAGHCCKAVCEQCEFMFRNIAKSIVKVKRANESEHESVVRRTSNRVNMAKRRANESEHMPLTKKCPRCGSVGHCCKAVCQQCEFVFRNKANKKSIVKVKRANESEHESIVCRASNRVNMAKRRANENEHESVVRRTSNRVNMAKRRANENEHVSVVRRTSNRVNMAKRRTNESEHESVNWS